MTIEYGQPTRTYRGKGVARFSNNATLPCQVRIVQLENGSILVRCLFSPRNTRTLPLVVDLRVESVTGRADSGLRFETQGELFVSRQTIKGTGYRTITLIAQEVILWSDAAVKSGSRVRFGLVNFEFSGNEPAERHLRKGRRTTEAYYLSLKLTLPWGEVNVHPVPAYNDVLPRIKAQKGIAVTAEAVVEAPAESELSETIKRVSELCRLLSLARGTKINWVNAESVDRRGNPGYIILRQSVTWPFSSLVLIDHRNPRDTAFFVKKVYPAYLRHQDRYNLEIAIEQYLDAKRETAYLQTRGLAAVALIDSLLQLYASRHKLTEIVKGFGRKKSGLRQCVKSFITSGFPDIKAEELDEMLQKIPELNRRSFLTLLRLWTQGLGLEISESELSAVRDTRNSLTHRMCFRSRNHEGIVREYFRLISLIDQAFLKLLDYTGAFVHIDLETLAFERKKLE